jgi:tRNA C32,U32 (ribose-2'-O)-methylase TrmJ
MENNRENRGRGKNFTNEEVLVLAELVAKNRSVIENKQSGAITHEQEESAWQKLTEQFNAVTSGDRRTTKMLMEKWRNTKKKTPRKIIQQLRKLYTRQVVDQKNPSLGWKHQLMQLSMT